MPQTGPDFMLMLGFYHNFSIPSPKKISCKIFAMLSKKAAYIHYWALSSCALMPQTRPDFVLMLGFYHNFSVPSPKKISCKIFAMLSKTQHIFITKHYLHAHYYLLSTGWSSCPYIRTNYRISMRIFQWQTRFHWAMSPMKLRPNPIWFFPVGAFKK